MSSPSTLVHERLARTKCPLYLTEISLDTKLSKSEALKALHELWRQDLAEPASWRLTEKGRLV